MAITTFSFSWANGKAELGSQLTLKFNRPNQNYRYTVNVAVLNSTNKDESDRIWLVGPLNYATTQVIWTPPLSLAQYASSNSPYIKIRFYISCYELQSGGGYLFDPNGYSPDPVQTVSLPASVVPTISSVTFSDSNGWKTKFGDFVSGKSALVGIISAQGVYGSTISQYKLSTGSAYSVGASSEQTITANQFNVSGTVNVTATVTDSRGRYAQTTNQITVLPYNAPSLSGTTAYRYNTSTEKEDDESSTVRVICIGSIADLNGLNTATVKVEYKLATASEWTTFSTTTQSGPWNYNVDVTGIDANSAYDIRVIAIDGTNTSGSTIITISTATPVMDFYHNGKGLAIGKVASSEGFNVAMATTFDGVATFENGLTSNSIKYVVGGRQREAIAMIEGGTNGDGIKMGAGGVVVIGSGESMNAVADGYGYSDNGGGSEYTHICSDNSVYIQTGCQNGFSSRKEFIFGSNGTFSVPNHIYMNNNVALCGDTTSGSVVTLLRMNTSNQVELNWTSGGLRGRVMKQLWSGTWTSGNVTVSDQMYYNVFLAACGSDANNTEFMIGWREKPGSSTSAMHFINMIYTDAGALWINAITLKSNSSTQLNYSNGHVFQLLGNAVWDANSKPSIRKLYGLL